MESAERCAALCTPSNSSATALAASSAHLPASVQLSGRLVTSYLQKSPFKIRPVAKQWLHAHWSTLPALMLQWLTSSAQRAGKSAADPSELFTIVQKEALLYAGHGVA